MKKPTVYDDSTSGGKLSQKNLALVGLGQLTLLVITASFVAYCRANWSLSFFAGGLIQILPAMYFGWSVFKDSNSTALGEFVNVFYRGEMVKFLLTALGFVVAFDLVKPLYVPALFAGYSLMLAAHIVGVARFSR